MTLDEWADLMRRIVSAFPTPRLTAEQRLEQMSPWFRTLGDFDVDDVNDALVEHERRSKWTPTLSELVAILEPDRKWEADRAAIAATVRDAEERSSGGHGIAAYIVDGCPNPHRTYRNARGVVVSDWQDDGLTADQRLVRIARMVERGWFVGDATGGTLSGDDPVAVAARDLLRPHMRDATILDRVAKLPAPPVDAERAANRDRWASSQRDRISAP